MVRSTAIVILFSAASVLAFYDVTNSIQKTADILMEKLELAAQKNAASPLEVKSIKEEILAIKEAGANNFLVKSSKILERIRVLECPPDSYGRPSDKGKFIDHFIDKDFNNFGFDRDVYLHKKVSKVVNLILKKTNSTSRIAIFAFGQSGYKVGTTTKENYDLANFHTNLLTSFENKNRMILAGDDLLDICRENSLDLEPINPKNIEAISRFLKKTRLDVGLFGILENNSMVVHMVYPNGDFEILDDFYQSRGTLVNDPHFFAPGTNKFDFWFEIESDGRWKRIELIEDRNTERSGNVLYLPLPDAALSEKSKIRLLVKNRGADFSPNAIRNLSRYGRLIGLNMTIDGIDLFLRDGKGLPSLPNQGRKLLISPPRHSIEDIGGYGFAVRTAGDDESLLKVEGFLDAKLNNERPFFIGTSGESFATQFLGSNLKPLGFITLNFSFQKLRTDQRVSVGKRAGIGALPPRPVDIKVLKVDFYDHSGFEYVVAYKTRSEINNLIPMKDQKIFQNE